MTTTIKKAAPDQTERVNQLIEPWLTLDVEAQYESLARIIAAAVHPGPGSALERFAGIGLLDPQAALEELNHAQVPFTQEAWLDNLGRFILYQAGRP